MIDVLIAQHRKVVAAKIRRLEEELGRGKNIPDYPAYREKVGELRGHRQALQDFDQLVAQLYGQEEMEDE